MFGGMDQLEIAFWICAVGGTVFFILKTLLMIVAGIDHDLDVNHDATTLGHEGVDGSDAAFKLLSINSLTGFVMMFGWIGLSAYKQFYLSGTGSFVVAFVGGSITFFITAKLFKAAGSLVDPGSQFRISETIGMSATVYQSIPAEGKGQIQIDSSGLTRELDAVSKDGESISSGQMIKVVEIIDPHTVAVRKL